MYLYIHITHQFRYRISSNILIIFSFIYSSKLLISIKGIQWTIMNVIFAFWDQNPKIYYV